MASLHTHQENRARVAQGPSVAAQRGGEGPATRGYREGSSPNRARRRRYYRIGHYGGRHPLGVLDHIALLLAYNRTLSAGERVRWGWGLLAMAALFVAVAGWSVVL